eukprot:15365713-Ditylum_brightwellii.AAC.2
MREKFGIRVPKSTREAMLLDKANGDNKWGDTIVKEMSTLERLCVFKYYDPGTTFKCKQGWHYAPMQMIFNIKQDLRRKTCFVESCFETSATPSALQPVQRRYGPLQGPVW